MKHLFPTLFASLVILSAANSQPTSQFTPDALTRALWHFNESAGTVVHDTASVNNGSAYGTSIVPGRFGNARSFNGSGDYVSIPSATAFDFDTTGFTIDVWFKTTQSSGIILRRGLTPDPGFMISTLNGHVVGMIGTTPGYYPDELLSDSSTGTFNDGAWHLATLVRDRTLRKLLLYVDGALAGNPANDNFTLPLSSSRPLTLGRWESEVDPAYFAGSIDEVRISRQRPSGSPVAIAVNPAVLIFGRTRAHTSDTLALQVSNIGTTDSLHISSFTSDSPLFGAAAGPMVIPPFGTKTVFIWYAPSTGNPVGDTTVLRVASDDPVNSVVRITMIGSSYAPILPNAQFTPDSLTRGLWHFNEVSGSVVHDTAGGLDGTAYGTTIVPGPFGNARSYNGYGDYVIVPSNKAFDFDTSSFTIDAWFRTSQQSSIIVRRGLANEPGFMISLLNGHVVGMIGTGSGLQPPNALISDTSFATYTDNVWHLATMVRNRSARKLLLYVDGVQEGNPADDNFPIPLNSTRPLTIGRWENDVYASYFQGTIDEVRLSSPRQVRFPAQIDVQPTRLDFGLTKVSVKDTLVLQIVNSGYRDSLRVTALLSTNPRFNVPAGPIVVAHGSNVPIPVVYSPLAAQVDTGTITIASNDPAFPTVSIQVTGQGFAPLDNPAILSITRIATSYNQARVIWVRSRFDTIGITNSVAQYSIWHKLRSLGKTTQGVDNGQGHPDTAVSPGPVWEYIQTIPAIGVDLYACVIQLPSNYNGLSPWEVYMVVAQTKNLGLYLSPPDSVTGGNVTGTGESSVVRAPDEVTLNQNYPNPFNPSTTIRYGLPGRTTVSLIVYNALGQAVATLVNGEQETGYHEVRFDGSNLASGIYFCRLKAGQSIRTNKILLLR